jgi:hypothetical protein
MYDNQNLRAQSKEGREVKETTKTLPQGNTDLEKLAGLASSRIYTVYLTQVLLLYFSLLISRSWFLLKKLLSSWQQ